MDGDSGAYNNANRPAYKNKKNKGVRCDDPELAAEIRFAKENGDPIPTELPSTVIAAKVVPPKAATILQDIKKVAPNQTKMCKKARNRGVSGCSIKKDGGRFDYGLEDIYLTEDHADDSFSETDSLEKKTRSKRVPKSKSNNFITKPSTPTDNVEDNNEDEYSKMQIKLVVLDYFENGDLDEAIVSIRKYATDKNCLIAGTAHIMSANLEGGSSWGLLASNLLTRLKAEDLISRYTVMKATEQVLLNLEELVLDHPHAVSLISRLLARMMSDQLISEKIITAIRSTCMGHALAIDCCTWALSYANQPLMFSEMPSGDHLPLPVLSNQLKSVLKEYLFTSDIDEAAKRTLKLKVPHFSHELVFLAGEMAMEKMHDSIMDQLATLLKHMFEEGEILGSCVTKGFERLYGAIPNMSLDLPAVYSLASLWTQKCLNIGLITPEIAATCPTCPTTVRRRFLSEGPNGKLICMDEDSLDSGISGCVSES